MEAPSFLPRSDRVNMTEGTRVDRAADQAVIRAALSALNGHSMSTREARGLKRALDDKKVQERGRNMPSVKAAHKKARVAQQAQQPLEHPLLLNLDG